MLGDREHDEDGTGGGDGRRVLLAPVDMDVNPAIADLVWDAFDALPSQTLPRKTVRPVRRLLSLAQALSRDGLRMNARKHAYQALFAKLDGQMAEHKDKVAAASRGVLEVEGETLVVRVVGGEVRDQDSFVEEADDLSVDADFRAAGRVLNADLVRAYADHLAEGDEDDDGLFDAHVKVAALAQVEGVSDELGREADRLCGKWFDDYRVAIKGLSDERRAVYDEIKGISRAIQAMELKRPRVRTEETQTREGAELPTRKSHLMSDLEGDFPIDSLNRWEIKVLDKEMGRDGFLAWYRNPPRPSSDSLAIAYKDIQGHWHRMCPDFLFFHRIDQDVKASIVDPHGYHLSDALPKLRGLADFAATHRDSFHRIESVAEMDDGVLRVLDLTDPNVRDAVQEYDDIKAVYLSGRASTY